MNIKKLNEDLDNILNNSKLKSNTKYYLSRTLYAVNEYGYYFIYKPRKQEYILYFYNEKHRDNNPHYSYVEDVFTSLDELITYWANKMNKSNDNDVPDYIHPYCEENIKPMLNEFNQTFNKKNYIGTDCKDKNQLNKKKLINLNGDKNEYQKTKRTII